MIFLSKYSFKKPVLHLSWYFYCFIKLNLTYWFRQRHVWNLPNQFCMKSTWNIEVFWVVITTNWEGSSIEFSKWLMQHFQPAFSLLYNLFSPFTPKISLVILLTVCHTILQILFGKFGFGSTNNLLIDIFL